MSVSYSLVLNGEWVKVDQKGVIPSPRHGLQMVYQRQTDSLFVFGCFGCSDNNLYQFFIQNSTWVIVSNRGNSAPNARNQPAMGVHDITGDIFLSGGLDQAGRQNSDLWTFSYTDQRWSLLSDNVGIVPTSKHSLTIDTLSNTIYVVLGPDSGTNDLDLWSYSLDTGNWTLLANPSSSMETCWCNSAHVHPVTRNIYYWGYSNVHYFNVTNSKWTFASSTLNNDNAYGNAMHHPTGIFFSYSGLWSFSRRSFIFDTNINSWFEIGPAGRPDGTALSGAAFRHPTGDFYEFGGKFQNDTRSRELWYYHAVNFSNAESSVSSSEVLATSAGVDVASSSSKAFVLSFAPFTSSTLRTPSKFISITTASSITGLEFFIKSLTNDNYQILIIVAIGAFILICLIIYVCRKRRLNRREKSKSTDNEPQKNSDETFDQSSSESTGMSTSSIVGTSTLVNSEFELSVPGYMNFRYGLDYRLAQQIASGGFGRVCLAEAFHAKLQQYGPQIIVKELKNTANERVTKLFYQEVAIMKLLAEEKHIAKILGYSPEPLCILMKYYKLGSLQDILKRQNLKKISTIICFAQDIAHGIMSMHAKGLVHCDLKPANILVDHDEQDGQLIYLVLTDFGITRINSSSSALLVKEFDIANMNGASLSYAAPEFFQHKRQESLVPGDHFPRDIYSFAVVLYEMLCGNSPWQ